MQDHQLGFPRSNQPPVILGNQASACWGPKRRALYTAMKKIYSPNSTAERAINYTCEISCKRMAIIFLGRVDPPTKENEFPQ